MMLALVLLPPNPIDEAIGLYNGWRDRNPVHEYRMKYRSGERPPAPVTLRIDWNRKWIYYRAEGPLSGNYELSFTDRGWLDLDREDRMFDEQGITPRVGLVPSRMTGAIQNTFPVPLYRGNLRDLLPAQGNPKRNDQATFQGKPSIELTAQVGSANEPNEYRAIVNIAPDGTLQRIFAYSREPMAPVSEREWIVESSRAIEPGYGSFSVVVPADYTPYSVPDPGPPMQSGESPKFAGWTREGNSETIAAQIQGKMAVVAILSPDDPLTREAVSALNEVSRSGLPVFALSDSGKPFKDAPYFHPGPEGLAELNPPATPYFYLIDRNGRIQAAWMGIERDKALERAREIIAESQREIEQ